MVRRGRKTSGLPGEASPGSFIGRRRTAWRLRSGLLGVAILCLLLGGCLAPRNVRPVAAFTATPPSGPAPLEVTFDSHFSDDPDGRIVERVWDFGGGTAATDAVVRRTFETVGVHRVTLRVTDDDGATDSYEETIEVLSPPSDGNDLPSAWFTATPIEGGSPLEVRFDGLGSSDRDGWVVAWNWDFGDGSSGSGSVMTHVYRAEATTGFRVTLVVTDDRGGRGTATGTVRVLVPEDILEERPTATFTASTPFQVFHSDNKPGVPSIYDVEFDPGESTPGSGEWIVSYAWDFGDGSPAFVSSNHNRVLHVYAVLNPSETYAVKLRVTDSYGAWDEAIRNVTIIDD
jgi:PKD repeat protein